MSIAKRLCRLDNGATINIANMNPEAKLNGVLILTSRAEPRPSLRDESIIQYTFSSPETGWFTNLRKDDMDRLSNVLLNEEGDEFTALVLSVHPIMDVKPSALAKMKPAFATPDPKAK